MSREVDERVVQMQLETGAFERVAQRTIGILNSIKDALNIGSASKTFDNINASASKVSGLDKMANAVDIVSDRFSNLGIIGMTALQNITNRAINAGTEMLKSLTVAPIGQGFDEYELKMGAVQTIMASTGRPLEEINGYLNELNTYADRTIYSFSDMTQNIGKFTNAGVDLEKAVKAIQGISNAAALSGSNAQQASHAMYNFAQAISSGFVKLIDWKSIELAGMATVEFKQQLIDTGLALGTLVKEGDKYVSTTTDMKGKVSEAFDATTMFNDSLSHQWMTTDVLVATLNKYSDETIDLGKRAFAAAQDVKTFSQLMDTLKEAVGSGWAQTFELIFGDFNEAKELWTSVSNAVGGFIDRMSTARNEMLQFWHDNGGRAKFFEGFANIVKGLVSVVKPLSDAWSAIMPKVTGKDLVNLSEKFADITSKMRLSENAAKGLNTAAKILLIPLRVIVEIAKIGIKIFGKAIGFVGKLVGGLLSFVGVITNAIESAYNWIAGLEVWGKIFEKAQEGMDLLAGGFEYLRNAWGDFVESFAETEFAKGVLKKIEDIQNGFSGFKDFLKGKITGALEYIANIDFKSAGDGLLTMAENAGKFMISIKDLPIVQGAIDALKSGFKKAADSAKKFVGILYILSGGLLNTIKDKFSKLQSLEFDDVKTEFGKVVKKVKDYASTLDGLTFGEKLVKISVDILKGLAGSFRWLIDKIGDAKDAVVDFFTTIVKKAAEHGLFDDDTVLGQMIDFMSKITTSIKEFVGSLDVGTKLKHFGDIMLDFATNVKNALSGLEPASVLLFVFGLALTLLSTSVAYLIAKTGKSIGEIGEIGDAIKNLIKSFGKRRNTVAMVKTLAASLVLIAGALALLALLPTDKLIQAGVAMGIVLGVIGASAIVITALTKKSKTFVEQFNKFAQGALMLSAGILALALAFRALQGEHFDLSTLERLGIIATIAVMLGGISIVLSRYGKDLSKGSLFLLMFSLSIMSVVKTLSKLKGMDTKVLQEGAFYVMGLMAAFSLLSFAAKDLKFSSALGMTLMLLNVRILGSVVKSLAKMKPDLNNDAGSIIISAIAIFTTMAALMAITRLAGPHAIKGAVAMIMISFFFDKIISVLTKMAEIKAAFSIERLEDVVDNLFVILGGLSLLMLSTVAVGKRAIKGAVAVSIIAAATLLLASFIEKIAKIQKDDVDKASKVLIGIGVAIAAIMLIMRSFAKVDSKAAGKIVTALGVLFTGIAIMSFMDIGKIISSTLGLSTVLLSLASLMKVFGKMTIEKGIRKTILMVGLMTSSAFILNRMAKDVDWKSLIAAGVSLSAVILALTVATNFAKVANKQIGSLTFLALATIIPATILAGLSFFAWKGMIGGAVSLGILVNALAAATRIAKSVKATAILSLAALSAVSVIAVAPLSMLSYYDWKGMIGGAISLGILMNALAAATKIAQNNIGGAASIAIMSLGLIAASYALSNLASVNSNALIAGVVALGLAITILGVAGYALQGVDKHILVVTAALAVFAGAAWLFAQAVATVCEALLKFKDVTQEQAGNIGAAFAIILLSFTITLIKGIPDVLKAVYWSGQQIVSGFIAGLASGAKPIIDVAKFLFAVPIGIIKKIWKIASPSRVAKKLASFIGSGFEEGLYNSIFGVEDASEALGNSSLGALTNSAETASSGLGGIIESMFGSFTKDLNVYDIGSEQGSLLGEGFASGFNLETLIGDMDISTYFNSAFDGITDIFKNGGLNASLGLEDGLSELPNIFSEIPNQLQGAMSSVDLYGEGFDLTSVLGDGIEDGLLDPDTIKGYVQDDLFGSFDLESIFGSGFTAGETYKSGILSAFTSDNDQDVYGYTESTKNDKRFEGVGGEIIEKVKNGFEKGYFKRKDILKTRIDRMNRELSERFISEDSQKKYRLSGYMLSGEFANAFFEKKQKALNNADAIANATADVLGGANAQRKHKLAGWMINAALVDGMHTAGSAAVDAANALSENINRKLQGNSADQINDGKKTIDNYRTGMLSSIPDAEKVAKTASDSARDQFVKNEPSYRSSAVRSIDHFRIGIKDQTAYATAAAVNVAQNVLNGASSKNAEFYGRGRTGTNNFISGVSSLVSVGYSAGYSVGSNATSGMSYGVSTATSIGVNAAQGLINGMVSKQAEVNRAAASLASAAAAAMQAALQIHSPSKVTENIGNQSAQGLVNGTQKAINNASNMVASAGAKVGASINTGISQGAKKTTSTISKAGTSTGKTFLNGLTQTLKVHSPSKEAENIAFFTADGFVNGIQKATESVGGSAEQMGDAAIKGLKTAVNSAIDVISSDDMTPVISPVVDLSNVTSSVDDINNLMNTASPKITLDSFTLDSVQATAMSMKGRSTYDLMHNLYGAQNDNSDVVRAINELSEQMWTIRDAISGMQVMLDSSALVGQILPNIDKGLNTRKRMAQRGGLG